MEKSEDNEYKIINFVYSPDIDKDKNYVIKNYKYEHKYIISKEDYEEGIKYLKGKNKNFNNKFFYFYNYNDIISNNCRKNNKVTDFVLVDSKFLKSLECDENFYEKFFVVYFESGGKHFIYFYDEQILEITDINYKNGKEINKSEVENNENSKVENKTPKNNIDNNTSNENDNEKKDIIKTLILLYANEKHFQQLLHSPIADEYEFKDYYLINKDFINNFQVDNQYEKLSEILEEEKYNYSYNGFIFNLNDIAEMEQLSNLKIKLNSNKEKEKDFYPEKQKINYKNNETIKFPDKFIIVSENLFDLLYKSIELDKEKYNKKKYRHKILIGDNVLFIKDKNKECRFAAYRLNNNKMKLFYLFEFDEKKSFYEEVYKYIKGKDFFNYILEKNLKTKKNQIEKIKDEEAHVIGKYNSIRDINNDDIKDFKAKMILNKIKNIYYSLKNYTALLYDLKDNNIDISDINKICKKMNNNELSCLKTGIILNSDLVNLKKKIFYEQLNNLLEYGGKKENEKIESKLIKELSNSDKYDLKKILKEINIFQPEEIINENNKNKDYNLINIDIKSFGVEQEENEKIQDCYYFKNKGEFYIIYAERKKLFKIIYNEEADNFKLERCISEGDSDGSEKEEKEIYEKIVKNIKDLENKNKILGKKIKEKFDKISSLEKYYLISSKWIQELKNKFKKKYKNFDVKSLDFLLKLENIRPENIQNEINYKKEVPNDFDIIEKNLFEEILENLNKLQNDIKLYSEYIYDVSFGGELILVKEIKSNDIFIYSLENEKYKLEYIIYLNNEEKISLKVAQTLNLF